MAPSQAGLGKALFWGGLTAILYGFLFHYSESFRVFARTTLDACAIQEGMTTVYYNGATPETCGEKGGEFVAGTWWYVFAPIVMAFALSYTHGIFTGQFWDVVGLKAKK